MSVALLILSLYRVTPGLQAKCQILALPAGLRGSPLGCMLPCRFSEVQNSWREQGSTNAACTDKKGFGACNQSTSLLFSCTDTLSECQKGSEGPQHPGSHHTPGTTPWVPGKHASMEWDACGLLTGFWLFIPTNIDSLSPATGTLGKA